MTKSLDGMCIKWCRSKRLEYLEGFRSEGMKEYTFPVSRLGYTCRSHLDNHPYWVHTHFHGNPVMKYLVRTCVPLHPCRLIDRAQRINPFVHRPPTSLRRVNGGHECLIKGCLWSNNRSSGNKCLHKPRLKIYFTERERKEERMTVSDGGCFLRFLRSISGKREKTSIRPVKCVIFLIYKEE